LKTFSQGDNYNTKNQYHIFILKINIMKNLLFAMTAITMTMLVSCKPKQQPAEEQKPSKEIEYLVDRFADANVMRYTIPGWDSLSLSQKKLVYFLSQAALAGRDIIYDQNYKNNLVIRKTLETIYEKFTGDRNTSEFKEFSIYLKEIWFSNGIHHHASTDKIIPGFDSVYFRTLIAGTKDGVWPVKAGQTTDQLFNMLIPIIFDPSIDSKRVSLDPGKDLILSSANNFYEGVSEKEATSFYKKMSKPNDPQPVSYGLNSKLIKKEGKITEDIYKVGGLYSPALEKVVYWLEQAVPFAENDQQKASIQKLIEFYSTGDLKTFDDFNILWVKNLEPTVDFVNGFTEVYGDPLGMKATWEAVVNIKDFAASERTRKISEQAQWFEDHSPVDQRFKKKEVKGVSAKVITVTQLGGDCYPTTPIGINLPNADWIRKVHGSKSVTMDNITYSYEQVRKNDGSTEEFSWDEKEIKMLKEYGQLAGNLHTDLHECLGHGSGQLLPGVSSEALKNYSSVLEEARADLFALYYLMDPKMVELGLMPSLDAAKAEYIGYIKNGMMTQLRRIKPGKDIEQAHMRNRQLIALWAYEKGADKKVIEKKIRDGKTFIVINDFDALRQIFGEMLAEIQRIKSEGDLKAGKMLVEKYAVKVDQELHKEVLARFEKLNLASYGGFVNPVFVPVKNDKGEITDIKVEYTEGYLEQNLRYSKEFSYL
jgi:dipeptidyl-peptidase III